MSKSGAPTACVLIIGNEILSGKTQDVNLQFMAEAFARLGITLAEARVLPDQPPVIAAVLNECRTRYTYVVTTGGIGPTHDDVTAAAVADALGTRLVVNDEAKRRIARSGRDLNPARLKMAMIPEDATLIDNPVSQAPGFRIENVFVLAGVPSIARAMFAAIEPELERGAPIVSASVDVFRSEGEIAAPLEEIAARFPEVEIGSYPFSRDGRYAASLVVRGTDRGKIEAALAAIKTVLAIDD